MGDLLRESARYGDPESVRDLLSDGSIDVNECNERGNTALHMASANGHAEVVRLLLMAHRPPSSPSPPPPGAEQEQEQAAEGNGRESKEEQGQQQHREGARLVNVNARNEHGNTALHWVATQPVFTKEHEAVVRLLLAAGAHTHIRNERDHTPLDEASDRGHAALCDLLFPRDEAGPEAGGQEEEEEEDKNKEENRTTANGTSSYGDSGKGKGISAPIRCGYGQCGQVERGEKKFSRCSRCKKTHYCSRECQKKDWPTHKLGCPAN